MKNYGNIIGGFVFIFAIVLMSFYFIGIQYIANTLDTVIIGRYFIYESFRVFSLTGQPESFIEFSKMFVMICNNGAALWFAAYFGLVGYLYYFDWKYEPQLEMFGYDRSTFGGTYHEL